MEKIVFIYQKEKLFYIQQPKELPTQWEQKMAEQEKAHAAVNVMGC